jgi:hypothetical protein
VRRPPIPIAAQFAPFSANVRPVLRPKQPCTTFFQGARKQGVTNLRFRLGMS